MDRCTRCCIIFLFYIKPQQEEPRSDEGERCIIFLFYIKPQPTRIIAFMGGVVLYFYSTSNHNLESSQGVSMNVVLYFYSTSNHNEDLIFSSFSRLYYISILHQTTTRGDLILSILGCIIFLFYIKPQL